MEKIELGKGKTVNVLRSFLIPLLELNLKIIKDTELLCLQQAIELWGDNQNLSSRGLTALDMGYMSSFSETSQCVINQWNQATTGRFVVSTATIIGIYGLKLKWCDDTKNFPPINSIRLCVNGARIAQWSLECHHNIYPQSLVDELVSHDDLIKNTICNPIIASEDNKVEIFEYTRVANTEYSPIWLGVVVEKLGLTLMSNRR